VCSKGLDTLLTKDAGLDGITLLCIPSMPELRLTGTKSISPRAIVSVAESYMITDSGACVGSTGFEI
jgi:hypothetical protein